jgi:WD repeat-containing protein 35
VGTPVDSKLVGFEGSLFGVSRTHVVLGNENYIYAWQYKTLSSKGSFGEAVRRVGKETSWFIGEKPNPALAYNEAVAEHDQEAEDIIYSIFVNDQSLYVGLESGAVNRYIMPHISLEATRIFIKPFPVLLAASSDNSKLAYTDIGGNLSILNISVPDSQPFETEKKDVWQLLWAEDHPDLLAVLEKNKLSIIDGPSIEKFVGTDAVICQFRNLKVKGVYLDDLMKSPDGVLVTDDYFMEHESVFYREFMDTLKNKGLAEATRLAEGSRHRHLWEVIAEKALTGLDFREAERALLKIDDYKGTKLIRKIEQMDERDKQRAEVMAYYGNYDQAEQIYRGMDRKDLAVQMRVRIGDWFKVSQMLKEGSGYDEVLQKVNDELGYYFMDRMDWVRAAEYFLVSKNYK